MLDVVFLILAVAIGFLIGSIFVSMLGITSRKILIVFTLCISACIGAATYFRFKYVRKKLYDTCLGIDIADYYWGHVSDFYL